MPRTMRSWARRLRGLAGGLAVGGALLATACASNPVTGHREVSLISEAEELEIGRRGDAEIRREMGVYDDDELQRYVTGVGERIAAVSHRPNLPWTFTVVDAPAVNAFALPGGIRLRDPGAARAPGRRGRARRRDRTRGGPRHRPPRVAAVHAIGRWHNRRAAGQHLRARRRPIRRSGQRRPRHALPQVRPRRRARIRPARGRVRHQGRMGSHRRAAFPGDAVTPRRLERAWHSQLALDAPQSRVARGQGATDRRTGRLRHGGRAQSRGLHAARRRPGLRRRSSRGRRPRPPVPASRPAPRHRLPGGLGGAQRARAGRRPARRREGADGDAGGQYRPWCLAERRRHQAHARTRFQARVRHARTARRARGVRGRLHRQDQGRRRGARSGGARHRRPAGLHARGHRAEGRVSAPRGRVHAGGRVVPRALEQRGRRPCVPTGSASTSRGSATRGSRLRSVPARGSCRRRVSRS